MSSPWALGGGERSGAGCCRKQCPPSWVSPEAVHDAIDDPELQHVHQEAGVLGKVYEAAAPILQQEAATARIWEVVEESVVFATFLRTARPQYPLTLDISW